MRLAKRPVRTYSDWKPQPLCILEKHYKQSIKNVGKATVVDRAVLAYFADGGDIDTNFKSFKTEAEHAKCLKSWMDKVSKYFDPYKSTRMPFGFGYYLLNALEEEDRKACEAELYEWLHSKETSASDKSLLQLISDVNKESAEAVQQALELAEKGLAKHKQRAVKEIDEAIKSLERLKQELG